MTEELVLRIVFRLLEHDAGSPLLWVLVGGALMLVLVVWLRRRNGRR